MNRNGDVEMLLFVVLLMFCTAYSIVVVIRIDHGQILSVNYETVRERLNGYSYTLAGKCSRQVSNHKHSGDEAGVTLRKNI